MRGSTLMAQRFDVRSLNVDGDPSPIADSVQQQIFGGVMSGTFSASENGVLAYQTGSATGVTTTVSQLAWLNRSGTLIAGGTRSTYAPAPNGQRFVVNRSAVQGSASTSPITVVVGWPAALGR